MRTLVLGGIRSGKSRWAESALSGRARVRYIATGSAPEGDGSWAGRVAEHRHRRPPHWTTVEDGDVAGRLREDPATPTLVDDLGGWLTRMLDHRGWTGGSVAAEVDDLAGAVGSFAEALVLVSPEVGLTVVPATPAGRRFADELGELNQRLAAGCDQVVLVVAGQPMWIKSPADPIGNRC